jgi:hypothetical protein
MIFALLIDLHNYKGGLADLEESLSRDSKPSKNLHGILCRIAYRGENFRKKEKYCQKAGIGCE